MAKRILLADDSITIQKVVELTFSDGDYEVTAVNNGNKAIQKLSEMRPDIILSDIIMPEKNGYEVCEFVKSHPEFRSIPVILLTGTFEPFDPDRADKAGCDAVVTKPFESQSLIHKVEELIEHAKTQAPTDRSPAPQFGGGESPFAAEPAASASAEAPRGDQFATGSFQPQNETPFQEPPTAGGETRAFPKMSFEDLSKPPEPPAPSSSPWDEPQPAGGETRAFPKMTFEDLDKPATTPPTDARPSSAWDEQPAPTGGETRAFPKMTFEDLDKSTPAPPPPKPEPVEPPSWTTMAPEPPPSTPSMWDEPPAFSGETKAFPKMSFEDLDKAASPPSPPPPPTAAEEPEPKMESPAMSSSSASSNNELSDEQVDRIARRVVQLMSDTVVRNIAWEVIPDLAEMVVKERIRQLESE
jgi:CheY-like chemotaxis protein